MWIIKEILEADYGCEERMPGEPLLCLVVLENESGDTIELEVSDKWLTIQNLNEGDEWPEDLECQEEQINRQNQWMDGYMQALEEMNE